MEAKNCDHATRLRVRNWFFSSLLEPYIGNPGRVEEVLSGKRPLTLPMIRALHQYLGIPAEVLIGAAPSPRTLSDQRAHEAEVG